MDMQDVHICRMCGDDLPPGGTRVIGICSYCIVDPTYEPVTIPGPGYGRRTDKDDTGGGSPPIPE